MGKAPQCTDCKMLTDSGENYSWVSAINTLGYPIAFWQLVVNPSLRGAQVNVLRQQALVEMGIKTVLRKQRKPGNENWATEATG